MLRQVPLMSQLLGDTAVRNEEDDVDEEDSARAGVVEETPSSAETAKAMMATANDRRASTALRNAPSPPTESTGGSVG